MNKEEKKILKEMINKNNTIDNTNNIREKKISKILRKEIAFFNYIKQQNTNKIRIENETKNACPTLFNDYKDIYTKLIENNLNYDILYNFLDELEKIENNKLDQHEASYNVGKLLKKIYIDSEIDTSSSKKNISPKKISYSEYKKI